MFRQAVVDKVQNDFQYHHHLGGGSEFGDIMGQLVPNIVYFGGQAAAQKWWALPLGYQRAALMYKTTLYAGATTLILKNIVRERRPNNGDNYSFPSGHTTTAFAFASVIAAEHAWYWGVTGYALATYVAVSRINDNEHYLHDVMAGAIIGTTFGIGLSHIYGSQNTPDTLETSNTPQVLFAPTNEGAMMSMQWRF